MREIKFRVWDTIENKMLYPSENWIRIGLGGEIFEKEYQGFWRLSKTLKLMQFTGLKDKNGKEIYDGDIFRGLHDFGPGGMAERIGVVSFNIRKGYEWNYWDFSTIEVIGNIHKNPELLGKS